MISLEINIFINKLGATVKLLMRSSACDIWIVWQIICKESRLIIELDLHCFISWIFSSAFWDSLVVLVSGTNTASHTSKTSEFVDK